MQRLHQAVILAFVIPLAAVPLYRHDPPPPPIVARPMALLNVDDGLASGDSLKFVVLWRQPTDSADLGPMDSTVYKVKVSAPFVWYSGGAVVPAGTVVRRSWRPPILSDSLKLARPAPGDTVNFTVTGFTQCRKGDCSVAGSGAFVYRRTWAPPATIATLRTDPF